MKIRRLLFYLTVPAVFFTAEAAVKLSPLFTNNMVLQQKTEAPIWGTASAGKKVTIVTSWDNKTYSVTAEKDGKWSAKIQTPEAGNTPYTITVSDGSKVTLKNVMIGEVWICSGQSNMEMPLAGWGKVFDYEHEIATANYPNIRLLHIDKKISEHPRADFTAVGNGWQVCSPATIGNFSSVAYFFGRHLQQTLNIPIGLINTSWGGTVAEAWTSGESLKHIPDFADAVSEIEKTDEKTVALKMKTWQDAVAASDKEMKNRIKTISSPAWDITQWKTAAQTGAWEKDILPDYDGVVWYRKMVEIPSTWAGKELHLNLGSIDDEDVTYFNGTKVGGINSYGETRSYTIPKSLVKSGKNVILVRVYDSGGGGGLIGPADQQYIELKSGGTERISIDAGWNYNAVGGERPKTDNPNRVSVLYNAMIHPLVPYAFQGAIWYQGEANVGRAAQYAELLPLMIRDWRKAWGREVPFYLVQLANYMERKSDPSESGWALLREAQSKTLHLENTGMSVTIDIGDADDIHPKKKQEVGRRLALIAENNTYNRKDVVCSGPVYLDYKIEGNKIRIAFDNAEGLKSSDGKELTGFAIAGSDRRFRWASAVIEGEEIVVSAPEVEFPVAVRYAWADNPACNLTNAAALPASPFRTDSW
ncbi:MAG: 9-O-acetylesterase [Tannerella sp.]|jgi:sialate O-acetylesterase|nr:9-O-acetylesterase [Tannerella sp.]